MYESALLVAELVLVEVVVLDVQHAILSLLGLLDVFGGF